MENHFLEVLCVILALAAIVDNAFLRAELTLQKKKNNGAGDSR